MQENIRDEVGAAGRQQQDWPSATLGEKQCGDQEAGRGPKRRNDLVLAAEGQEMPQFGTGKVHQAEEYSTCHKGSGAPE